MNLIQELCNEKCDEVALKIGNVFSINIVKNLIGHRRSKHIKMMFHYLREKVSERRLKLERCKSENQLNDLLTKGETTKTFKRLKNLLSLETLENLN